MQIDLIITEKQLTDSGVMAHIVLKDRLDWFTDGHCIMRNLENHNTRVMAHVDGASASLVWDAYQNLVNP